MKWQFSFIGVVTLALLLGTAHGASAQTSKTGSGPARPVHSVANTYHGGIVSPPLSKPKFTLTDTSGAPYDFLAKTQGYVTLLFFGYTHCPDMCPLQMFMIAQALAKIPPAAVTQFKVVFVTTDPERDTPKVLRAYLDRFDKRFIGLTGSNAAIEAAQIAANIPVSKKSTVRPDGAYEVGHAAFVLAYTKDDLDHVIYPVGMKQEDWVHDLPQLATETWTSR